MMHLLWLQEAHVVIGPVLVVTMQGCGCGGVGDRKRENREE